MRGAGHPSAVIAMLRKWIVDHSSYPYPTDGEKRELALICNLTVKQIQRWFVNARTRSKRQRARCKPKPLSNIPCALSPAQADYSATTPTSNWPKFKPEPFLAETSHGLSFPDTSTLWPRPPASPGPQSSSSAGAGAASLPRLSNFEPLPSDQCISPFNSKLPVLGNLDDDYDKVSQRVDSLLERAGPLQISDCIQLLQVLVKLETKRRNLPGMGASKRKLSGSEDDGLEYANEKRLCQRAEPTIYTDCPSPLLQPVQTTGVPFPADFTDDASDFSNDLFEILDRMTFDNDFERPNSRSELRTPVLIQVPYSNIANIVPFNLPPPSLENKSSLSS